MAVALQYQSVLTCVETPDVNVPAMAANQTITNNGFNTLKTLNAGTTPTVTKDANFETTLSSGAATVDLRVLTGTNGISVDLNGSKVRAFRAKAPATNGAAIVISKGASNGYTGFGASFSQSIPPGGEYVFYDGGNGTAVSNTVKTIDLAGAGSSDKLQISVVGGG